MGRENEAPYLGVLPVCERVMVIFVVRYLRVKPLQHSHLARGRWIGQATRRPGERKTKLDCAERVEFGAGSG
jgi:hypothetical protein